VEIGLTPLLLTACAEKWLKFDIDKASWFKIFSCFVKAAGEARTL
jgi:hypothetical protein